GRRRAIAGFLWVGTLVVAGAPYMVLGTANRLHSSTRLGHWPQRPDAPQTRPSSPLLAPEARARNLDEALNGLRYLKYVHPDDYSALLWARENLPTTSTLLEASGSQ